ncbi:allatostatin-A receptor-like [Aphis craccivora]|uniref:Allatostatin-A receptor-like n=1 Tax=Aphis craccivora TaxID=307492 RepID=A0A6G0Z7W6_APHCR|nr:allatostatin-A receptor-like [Aphis craccivora]
MPTNAGGSVILVVAYGLSPQSVYTFPIFFFLTSYAIPLAIICILYVLMLMRLWKGVNPGGQPPSAESRRGKKRVTRMVVVVVAIFAFCWFPIQRCRGTTNKPCTAHACCRSLLVVSEINFKEGPFCVPTHNALQRRNDKCDMSPQIVICVTQTISYNDSNESNCGL